MKRAIQICRGTENGWHPVRQGTAAGLIDIQSRTGAGDQHGAVRQVQHFRAVCDLVGDHAAFRPVDGREGIGDIIIFIKSRGAAQAGVCGSHAAKDFAVHHHRRRGVNRGVVVGRGGHQCPGAGIGRAVRGVNAVIICRPRGIDGIASRATEENHLAIRQLCPKASFIAGAI